ncbi:MAG: hypothetical protein ABJL55_16190 [Roseibium sp.]
MSAMFSAKSLHQNPTDIELIKEVTLQEFFEWLLQFFEGQLPEHIKARLKDLNALKMGFAPIYEELKDGDSVWLCRSRIKGPLIGHEGRASEYEVSERFLSK